MNITFFRYFIDNKAFYKALGHVTASFSQSKDRVSQAKIAKLDEANRHLFRPKEVISAANWCKSHTNSCNTYLPITSLGI